MLKAATNTEQSSGGSSHVPELQSLRGLAALIVAVSHITSVYNLPPGMRITIDALFNAHACLVVFFVLSGYVLTGSLLRRGLSVASVTGFYLARFFRLFPALWVVSALSALLLAVFTQLAIHPAMSSWFYPYLTGFPPASRLILSVFAIDGALIMPVWTIFVELAGSMLMPLVVAITLKRVWLFYWLVAGTAIATLTMARAPHRLDSFGFLLDFVLGAWAASYPWRFVRRKTLLKLSAAALLLVFFRFFWSAFLNGRPVSLYFSYSDPVPMIVESVAAFFLVGLLASEFGRTRLLRVPALTWLGDISYSLYLLHFPIAIVVAKLTSKVFTDATSPVLATVVLLVISLTVTFAIATLTYRFVEAPCIGFGRQLTRRITTGHILQGDQRV